MKLKYLKNHYNNELFLFEVDEEGTVYRQVTHIQDTILNSARPKEGYHFFLADQEIKENAHLFPIDKDEFEIEWLFSIDPYHEEWNQTIKEIYVGMKVVGSFEVNYPQGIILNLGNNRFGVMKIDTNYLNSYVTPNRKINAEVVGYDYENFWLILKEVN